ncbi:MAG: sulfatase-like hydrolase/transferase [Asticcacaulis sp.]
MNANKLKRVSQARHVRKALSLTTALLLAQTMVSGCVAAQSQSVAAVTPAASHQAQQPNVIIILTDDQGYSDVGFNGSKDIPTPNIDRIAHEGARFDRGYVTFPVCGPSRAGLLTGRYQDRFGFLLNPSENPDDPHAGLPLSEETMGQVVKPAGYDTMAIGKWHMGSVTGYRPLQRGFDEFYGFLNGGHNYYAEKFHDVDPTKVKGDGELYATRLLRNDTKVDAKGYMTDILSAEAVDYIDREHTKKKPFFLYLAYNAPHAPIAAPPKYTDRFPNVTDPQRKIYDGMVSAVDDGVGTILDKLDQLGIADNTIVFFLSDNGGPLVRAKNGSINLPLRGGKGDMFEGGVRVPFAVRWPAQIPAGIDYPHAVSSMDILATVVGVNHIDMTGKNPLDGVNLVPYLQDKTFASVPHDALFWRYHSNDAHSDTYVQQAVTSGDAKFVQRQNNKMLFDLKSDKGEQHNLIATDTKDDEKLEAMSKTWNSQMKGLSISIFNEWPVGSHEYDDTKTEQNFHDKPRVAE